MPRAVNCHPRCMHQHPELPQRRHQWPIFQGFYLQHDVRIAPLLRVVAEQARARQHGAGVGVGGGVAPFQQLAAAEKGWGMNSQRFGWKVRWRWRGRTTPAAGTCEAKQWLVQLTWGIDSQWFGWKVRWRWRGRTIPAAGSCRDR